MNSKTQNTKNYLLITLGLLTAFAPFVTDLYLPALPSLAAYFKSPDALVQMSLTMSMLGLATGQLFIGPVSDRFGRRNVLLLTLILFIITSIFCILSPSVHLFNLSRLFQGMSASGGIVIARSISADLYSGKELKRFLGMISAVNGIAPVLAPVLGGFIMSVGTWKNIFAVLLAYGLLMLLLAIGTRESLPLHRRSKHGIVGSFAAYAKLFRNKTYLLYLSVFMFSSMVLFAYIACSPFILQSIYSLSPMQFSLCFALNAIGITAGCMLGTHLSDRVSLLAGGISIFASTLICMASLLLQTNVLLVEASFCICMFSFGLLQPVSNAKTLDAAGENVGCGAAALGSCGFVMGAIVSPLVGLGNMALSSSLTLTIGGLLCLTASLLCLKHEKMSAKKAVMTNKNVSLQRQKA